MSYVITFAAGFILGIVACQVAGKMLLGMVMM